MEGIYLADACWRGNCRSSIAMEGSMATANKKVRLAAVGDIHCGKTSHGALQPLFSRVAEAADVLLLCGDLTDYGLPEEAQILVKELAAVGKVPIVGVLGNHDFQSGQQDEVRGTLTD